MGFGNIGIWQLLIVLLIVVVIFGTKRLRSMGGDVGGAIKSFRKAMNDGDEDLTPGALQDKRSAGESASEKRTENSRSD